MDQGSRLLRIGIFYDGNYFYHVSNYYCYAHPKRSRLSIPGLHEFIKLMVSRCEKIDMRLCQIVDCHYFRGRLPAMEANARQILLNERIFDDILMREGVVTHYLPMQRGGEKGVDVSLALETLELTLFKRFNVVVLIASDGDYVPLARKLNALGTRVMVLGWDFEYMDDNGNLRNTNTAAALMNQVSYPIRMHQVIDGEEHVPGLNLDTLFVQSTANSDRTPRADATSASVPNPAQAQQPMQDKTSVPLASVLANPGSPELNQGRIVQLKNGYGFLATESLQKNLFFFWEDVENCDFNQLKTGDLVSYELGHNDRGECAKNINLVSS